MDSAASQVTGQVRRELRLAGEWRRAAQERRLEKSCFGFVCPLAPRGQPCFGTLNALWFQACDAKNRVPWPVSTMALLDYPSGKSGTCSGRPTELWCQYMSDTLCEVLAILVLFNAATLSPVRIL